MVFQLKERLQTVQLTNYKYTGIRLQRDICQAAGKVETVVSR